MIGKELGQYRIAEVLGEGGMAAVYKGIDTRLDRDVAIKVILPGFSHSVDFLKRFEREARSIARLTHINIVQVINYGTDEGVPYLVMPHIPGGTLKDRLGKPIGWRQAYEQLIPVGRALGYAHQQNIVHRDVKPANILVTQSGDLVISDFGIAKVIGDDQSVLTATGTGIGTPAYMSPEQGVGDLIDQRADIYSLGIVLYEMLTGQTPYQADTPIAVIYKHVHEPLPSPRSFVQDLPDAVDETISKALAKDPGDRFQSMESFVSAMEAVLRKQDVHTLGKTVFVNRRAEGTPLPPDLEATVRVRPRWFHFKRPNFNIPRLQFKAPEIKPVYLKWAGAVLVLIVFILAAMMIFQHLGIRILGSTPQPGEIAGVLLTTKNIAKDPVMVKPQDHTPTSGLMEIGLVKTLDVSNYFDTIAYIGLNSNGWLVLGNHRDNFVVIMDPDLDQPLYILEGRPLAISEDGDMVALYGDNDTATIWNTRDGQLIGSLVGVAGNIALQFAPNGELIAQPFSQTLIRLWDVQTGEFQDLVSGHNYWIGIVFSPDGKTLASKDSSQYAINFWDISTGGRKGGISSQDIKEMSLPSYSPDGERFIYSIRFEDGTKTTSVVESTTLKEIFSVPGTDGRFDPNGRWILTAHDSGLLISDAITGSAIHHINVRLSPESWFSPDGDMFVTHTLDGDGSIQCYKLETWQRICDLPVGVIIHRLITNPQVNLIAVNGGNGTLLLFGNPAEK